MKVYIYTFANHVVLESIHKLTAKELKIEVKDNGRLISLKTAIR